MRPTLAFQPAHTLDQALRVPRMRRDRGPLRHPRDVPRSIPTWLPGHHRDEQDSCPSPLDTWWSLEDLWLRLHEAGRLHAIDADTLLLPCWRHWHADPALRAAVFDLERYAWGSSSSLERGSFVRTLDYVGGDLVCRLTPAAAMQGWPDGPALALLRAAFFLRLASHISHRGAPA
jgi:hypothetical protein